MIQVHPKHHMNYYSRNIKDPNFLAPAVTQRLASVEMMLSKIVGGALLSLKTLAFRSFQIVHDTSMVREALACLFGVPASHVLAHQALTESIKCQEEVSSPKM